jgi:hypothetical protein
MLLALLLNGACSPSDSTSDASSDSGAQATADSEANSAAQTMSYDGTALLEWTQVGDANWRVVNGAVQADAGNGFLLTPAAYGDFAMTLDFWVSEDANSGVFVRCATPEQIGAETCYEVNIFDQRGDQTYRTGGIVEVAAPNRVVYTGGRWNRYAITAQGRRLTVILNDHTVVDVEDDRYAEGPIALQYGAGTVLFRNVEIAPL